MTQATDEPRTCVRACPSPDPVPHTATLSSSSLFSGILKLQACVLFLLIFRNQTGLET